MILKSRPSRSGPNSYKKTRRLIYLGNPRGKKFKNKEVANSVECRQEVN